MSNTIDTNYSKDIDKFFRDKNKQMKLKRHIMTLLERNNKTLTYNSPIFRLPFNMKGSDSDELFKIIGIDRSKMKKEIMNIKFNRKYSDILKDPFYVVMALIIREVNKSLASKQNNRILNEELNTYSLYLCLGFYWHIQVKHFPYEPNENVSQYTINRLSNKFFFKKYNTVSTSLTMTALQNNENLKNQLMRSTDDDIMVYLMDLRSRLNNLVKNFATEIYKDIKQGNYLNSHVDVIDDEENYREGTNVSGTTLNITNKVTTSFTSENIDMRSLRISCAMTNTNMNIMRNTLSDIRENEIKDVIKLIQNIITVYIDGGKNNPINSIGTQRFIRESIALFTKSNTKDKRIIESKSIIDKFLTQYNSKYNQTERQATKLMYRKTIYTYFILIIANNY